MQTGIILPILQAGPATRAIRERWDAQAVATRVPPHITLLFPFRTSESINRATLTAVGRVFAAHAPFDLALGGLCGFEDGTVYLGPEPLEPIDDLIAALAAAFPDTPPYGGRFADSRPHLTLGLVGIAAELGAVATCFEAAYTGGLLPSSIRVETATLLAQGDSGRWRTLRQFPLG